MELDLFVRYGPALLRGLGVTLLCWVFGAFGGCIVGFVIACLRRYGGRVLVWPIAVYVEVVRGTPFMVQLFILYYGGPYMGLRLSPLQAGLSSFIVYGSPYFAEIFRSGFNAIPRGEIEAAQSVGLSGTSILRRIIVPQAMTSITAPLTNFVIVLSKETAILSVVTVPELLYQTQTMAAETFTYVEPLLVLSLFYWLLVVLAGQVGSGIEKRMMRHLTTVSSVQ